jgi:two-component system, response regulator, stage 0 sporulation protein F
MEMQVKLLYVDDEPINLMLFVRMFGKKYKILTAESGYLGLEVLQNTPDIKVIISDMKMPGMDGLEFIRKAKALYPNVLFYILTGYEITPDIQESMKNGLISDYFQKPFKLQDIDDSITNKLGI